jgi:CBS domain-containing protein
MLTVRDLLKSKGDVIWSVSPDTTTLDALRLMAEKHIGALLVLEEGKIAGIISERDFVVRIAQQSAADMQTPVKEYMTSEVITVTPDQTIEECMQIMTDRRLRHLPVLNKDQLAGLISIGDLVKGTITEQKILIKDLEKYITTSGFGV